MTSPLPNDDDVLIYLIRGDVSSEWTSANPVLMPFELAYDIGAKRLKIGDGVTAWNNLPWLTFSQTELDQKYTVPTGGIPIGTLDAATQAKINGALQKASNLSDLASVSTARTNLGLGGAAILNVGTATGTVAAGNDSRFTDTRTPTAGSVVKASLAANLIPYDRTVQVVSPATTRAVGPGDMTLGMRIPRTIQITSVYYRMATADASGSTTVELRRNGAQIAGTSQTIASGNQVVGSAVSGLTITINPGDIITGYITAVGTTPGKGLVAEFTGTWT